MTRDKTALDAAVATFEEKGGIATLRAEMDAFHNLRLLLYTEYPQLKKNYPNQWVAINETGVLASGDSQREVMNALRKSNIDTSDVALEYINTKNSVFILSHKGRQMSNQLRTSVNRSPLPQGEG